MMCGWQTIEIPTTMVQKTTSKNPRSTVGTVTEIYDYLRVLFARIGQQTCINCHKPVGKGDAQSMVSRILDMPEGTKVLILAPTIDNRKGEHREVMARLNISDASEYHYRRVSKKPRNPDSAPDRFEMNLIRMFAQNPDLSIYEDTGRVEQKDYHMVARPVVFSDLTPGRFTRHRRHGSDDQHTVIEGLASPVP